MSYRKYLMPSDISPSVAYEATAVDSDTISRRAAIDAAIKGADSYSADSIKKEINNVPPAEPYITHIIMETLAEFGIYGEEATIALIRTLKRIGRDDLIPPCAR